MSPASGMSVTATVPQFFEASEEFIGNREPWNQESTMAPPTPLLEVQVRAAGVAGVADGAELGARLHDLADGDQHRVEVGVERALAVAVVDDDVLAVAGLVLADHHRDDRAGRSGDDRLAESRHRGS